jgi:16S rRNA (cytidine1402-2'-O)-methyltransferase
MPLLVCATPIGNLEDVTLRVLRTLGEADVVLCEDTRRTRVLLHRHGIRARLLSYHEHNEAQRTAELLPRLEAGERVALCTDAGLPGISDPGARLVAGALDSGVEVSVLPGPSAVTTALVASGFASDAGFVFVGFLPRGAAALRGLIRALGSRPVVAFESPQRLPATLRVLANELAARRVAVCRELTKQFEEVVRGTPNELLARYGDPPKGEVTLVVEGGAETAPDEAAAHAAVEELVAAGAARRAAAKTVGRLTGVAPNRLYRTSL